MQNAKCTKKKCKIEFQLKKIQSESFNKYCMTLFFLQPSDWDFNRNLFQANDEFRNKIIINKLSHNNVFQINVLC